MTHRRAILYSSALWACASLLLTAFLFPYAAAQNPADMLNGQGSLKDQILTSRALTTAPGTGILIFKVFAERSGRKLDRQAVLQLVNLSTQKPLWQTTEDTSQGYDESSREGVFTNLAYGDYHVEISAVGFLSTGVDVKIGGTITQQEMDVVLHHDPAAVNLDISNAAMSPKARKETKQAIAALKSGKLNDAQKHLDEAYKAAPADPNLNFLLGYLYFQRKDYSRATNYLTASTTVNAHDAQALTLLGRTGLEEKNYPVARSALEQAVVADSDNWLPHNLLADTYLREKDYTKARDEAQLAIEKGKVAASPAELVLGQALVDLGKYQEGIQALNVFLEEAPQQPLAPQVRKLIADVQEHVASAGAAEASSDSDVDALSAMPAPTLTVKPWQPPGIDDVKPALAPNVTCPLEQVMEESGKRVQELVDDVTRFAAVEDLFHQSLDAYGNPVRTETRKFNYVASISEPEPGFLAVDEYRADRLDLSGYPDHIASTGFTALALVFHPHMRDNFAMICEGLGDWHGQASWLVRFVQRDDRPNRMQSYKVGNTVHPVKLKGRAWVTADKFQVVRIEAEMVNPMPEIQLLSEHQVVEYGPVPFRNDSLWLPKSAEIYFDFRKHRYYRRHTFDHYMLYSVGTEEKRKEPAAKPPRNPS